MENQTHTEELFRVEKGDSVEIINSNNNVFEATCVLREQYSNHPNDNNETNGWIFYTDNHQLTATIVTPDDDHNKDVPIHKELWDTKNKQYMGYIEILTIF